MDLMNKIREYVAERAGNQQHGVQRDLNDNQKNWLGQAFEPLACAGKDLPGKVLNYVLTGQDEAVLLELSRHSKELGAQLGRPGRLHGSHGGGKMTEKSMAGRAKFY